MTSKAKLWGLFQMTLFHWPSLLYSLFAWFKALTILEDKAKELLCSCPIISFSKEEMSNSLLIFLLDRNESNSDFESANSQKKEERGMLRRQIGKVPILNFELSS